jgi:hypothetical protein
MAATIALDNNQYPQDWFNKHCATIEVSTSLIFFAITYICGLGILFCKPMFALNHTNVKWHLETLMFLSKTLFWRQIWSSQMFLTFGAKICIFAKSYPLLLALSTFLYSCYNFL